MLAGIASNTDISVYLDPDEIERLESQVVDGVLVHWNYPKEQGTVEVTASQYPQEGLNRTIKVQKNNRSHEDVGDLSVYLNQDAYETLLQNGFAGIRYNARGDKIHLRNTSQLDSTEGFRLEDLEFYRDNRDNLSKEFSFQEEDTMWSI